MYGGWVLSNHPLLALAPISNLAHQFPRIETRKCLFYQTNENLLLSSFQSYC